MSTSEVKICWENFLWAEYARNMFQCSRELNTYKLSIISNPSSGSAVGVAQHLVNCTVARLKLVWLCKVTLPRITPSRGKWGRYPNGVLYELSLYNWNDT